MTTTEAKRRFVEYGPNEIAEPRPHAILTLLRKFWSPIPWMLEVTILIQVLLGKTGEAAIVGALLVFNAANPHETAGIHHACRRSVAGRVFT